MTLTDKVVLTHDGYGGYDKVEFIEEIEVVKSGSCFYPYYYPYYGQTLVEGDKVVKAILVHNNGY